MAKPATTWNDLPIETVARILGEVGDDLRLRGSPDQLRLYKLATVHSSFYRGILHLQSSNFIKVTAVYYKNSSSIQEFEKLLKQCVKSKFWSEVNPETQKYKPVVLLGFLTAPAPTPFSVFQSKSWFLACNEQTVCGLAAFTTMVAKSFHLHHLGIRSRNATEAKARRALLLPLAIYVRGLTHPTSIIGLDDRHTIMLKRLFLSPIIDETQGEDWAQLAIWLAIVIYYVRQKYSQSLGAGEAAFNAAVSVFSKFEFRQTTFRYRSDNGNQHAQLLSELNLIGLTERNKRSELEIHNDENMTVNDLWNAYLELQKRGEAVFDRIALNGLMRCCGHMERGKTNLNFFGICQQFHHSYKHQFLLAAAGQQFAAAKIMKLSDQAGPLFEWVKQEFTDIGVDYEPTIKWATLQIHGTRRRGVKEKYPKELKDKWNRIGSDPYPARYQHCDAPQIPEEMVPETLVRRWLDD